MPATITTPPADFTQPLALLRDCHRRIERFFAQLRSLSDRRRGGYLSGTDRQALETALNYLDQAARRHTEDEERSLFPRLRCHAALTELDRLESDHQYAAKHHQQMDRLGRRWLATGLLSPADWARLRELVDELTTTYADHIRCEDECVFVLAAQVLTTAELTQIGQEMAQRRAVDLGRPGSRCAERRRSRVEQR